jgi:N-acetylmuramoyl-L-alanine amidase
MLPPLPPLAGLRVVVDVQHLYREHKPHDEGTVYVLGNGLHVTEAHAALGYAGALTAWLTGQGATVLTNDPKHAMLVGYYSARNRVANAFEAHAYLACHLNAGRGSYAALEAMTVSAGLGLADAIGLALVTPAFPAILHYKVVRLSQGMRGAACIEACAASVAALVVEPFFGDNPRHQPLLLAPELKRVGEAIGHGVASWWRRRTMTPA